MKRLRVESVSGVKEFVVCPAEGRERARVVPRAQKDSLSLYPAEKQLVM